MRHKKAKKSRGIPILWTEIVDENFQMKEKVCSGRKYQRCKEENPCHTKGGALEWFRQLFLGVSNGR